MPNSDQTASMRLHLTDMMMSGGHTACTPTAIFGCIRPIFRYVGAWESGPERRRAPDERVTSEGRVVAQAPDDLADVLHVSSSSTMIIFTNIICPSPTEHS